MAEFLGRRFQWAGLVHVIRSGVISQPPGVLRGKCACSYLPLRSARRRPGRHAARSSIVRWRQKCSVAERTLTPADRTAGPEKATETSQANVRTDACSPADPGRIDDAGPLPPDGAAPRTRGRPDCPNRAAVDGPSSGLPAANVGTAMADRPGISASQNKRPSTSAASTAPLGPVWRAPIKRAQAVVPTAPRYGLYARPVTNLVQREAARILRLQSKYGSYTNQQSQ